MRSYGEILNSEIFVPFFKFMPVGLKELNLLSCMLEFNEK